MRGTSMGDRRGKTSGTSAARVLATVGAGLLAILGAGVGLARAGLPASPAACQRLQAEYPELKGKTFVDAINPHADLDGITRGGYKLVYQDKPSDSEKTLSQGSRNRGGAVDVWYSLGLRINADGTISDVRWGGPADGAKLAPGQKIIGINNRTPTTDTLLEAIDNAKGNTEPLHLLVQTETYIKPVDINYHDGQRYPILVRNESQKDYLDEILKPMVPMVSANPVLTPDR